MDWRLMIKKAWDEIRRFIAGQIKSRVNKESSLSLFAAASDVLLAFFSSIALAYLLGAEDFSLILLALAIITALMQVFDFHTRDGLSHRLKTAIAAGNPARARNLFTLTLVTDILLSAAGFIVIRLLVPPVSGIFSMADRLQPLLTIAAYLIPFTMLEDSLFATCDACCSQKTSSVLTITRHGLLFAGRVVGAFISVEAVLWATIIASAVNTLTASFFALRGMRQVTGSQKYSSGEKISWTAIREIASQGFRESITLFARSAEIILLGLLAPLTSIAMFRIAQSAALLFEKARNPIETALAPGFADAWSQNDQSRKKHVTRRALLIMGVLTFILVSLFITSAGWIVDFSYPADFRPTANLARLMVIALGVETVMGWLPYAANADGKRSLIFWTWLGGIVVRLALSALMAAKLGGAGVAFAYLLSALATTAFSWFVILPRIGLRGLYQADASVSGP